MSRKDRCTVDGFVVLVFLVLAAVGPVPAVDYSVSDVNDLYVDVVRHRSRVVRLRLLSLSLR